MPPLGHHIRLKLFDNRVIAPTPVQQRLVTNIVLEQGRRNNLLCTSPAEDHLHVDALCGYKASSRLVQRVASSVKQRLAIPQSFTHYPHEPIRDKRHLYNSVPYILKQWQRHGLPPEQALDGTNLPDLLGMRLVGAYTRDNLRMWLPRIHQAQFVEWLGVTALRTADGPVENIVEATEAAAGLVNLHGSSASVICARRALVEVVGDQLAPHELSALLRINPRTLLRLRHRPVEHALVRAIRLQLGVRAELRARRDDLNAVRIG